MTRSIHEHLFTADWLHKYMTQGQTQPYRSTPPALLTLDRRMKPMMPAPEGGGDRGVLGNGSGAAISWT